MLVPSAPLWLPPRRCSHSKCVGMLVQRGAGVVGCVHMLTLNVFKRGDSCRMFAAVPGGLPTQVDSCDIAQAPCSNNTFTSLPFMAGSGNACLEWDECLGHGVFVYGAAWMLCDMAGSFSSTSCVLLCHGLQPWGHP